MIIERSSFSGLGKFGSRWLGDNYSQYNYMGFSVTGIMMQNIMGMPLAGADICGHIGDTNADLCARWYNVGPSIHSRATTTNLIRFRRNRTCSTTTRF
jgi:alpha-glucosidase (family GH31 glycosyl hydrolase)